MKPQYEPKTLEQKLGYLVEECGEVMAAVGKTMRWGLESVNLDLPEDEQETNRDWIVRELRDLEGAINRARAALCRGDNFQLEAAAARAKARTRRQLLDR